MRIKKKKPYSESWCFREQAEDFTCVLTARIDYDEEGQMSGVLEVKLPWGSWYFDYAHPVNMNLRGSLFLVFGRSVFTEACIHLDIDEPGLTIKGDIYFEREYGACRVGLSRKIWAMEQVLSGELMVNGRLVSFDGGKGYLEETSNQADRQFWTQCNWFGERPFRIVCGSNEKRCFAFVDQDSYPIRMAWWKGAKIEYLSPAGFRMRQGRYVLEGWRSEEIPEACPDQTVRYRLVHKGDVLFDEISRRAGYVCDETFTAD